MSNTTLRDVAERAGLSVSAASLALSGNGRIPEATRGRVRAAAAELEYTPNGAARALRAKRHGAIGLLMFGPGRAGGTAGAESLTFYSEAVVAAADEALRTEHHVVLLQAHGWGSEAARKGELSHLLASARVDGAVCIGTDVTVEDVRAMERRRFPFVFIGKRSLPGVTVPYVATDYMGGGRLATEHLLGLGYRRIAVALTTQESGRVWIEDRITGHAVAMAAQGASGPRLELPAPSEEHASLAREWLAEGITAVFATSHHAASRVLGLCHLARVRVPAELAVVGFDDHPGAALAQPPLTVVRQPLASLGTLAVRTLLARLDGAPHEPVSAALPATLVVRESCGALHNARAAAAAGKVLALNGAPH